MMGSTILNRPLQNNNLKLPKFAWSDNKDPTANCLSFH